MRSRFVNIMLAVMSATLAVGLLIFGVLAATQIRASISGTFFFTVPSDAFFAVVNGSITGHAGNEITYNQETSSITPSFVPWNLANSLQFKEDGNGKPLPITFTFTIENKNEEKSIRINFLKNVANESKIKIQPDSNLLKSITLKSLTEMNYQETDKTTFTIVLAPIEGVTNFKNEPFSFSLELDFVN